MNGLAVVVRLWAKATCVISGSMLGVMVMVAAVQPDFPITVTCEEIEYTHQTAQVCTPTEGSPWAETDPVIGEWVYERDAPDKYNAAVGNE